jgi:hypothetical protein
MLEDEIKEWGGQEVTPLEVYADVFKFGEGYIQKNKDDKRQVANPLGYYRQDGHKHGHYRIMFEDDFPALLKELQEADFALLNGVSYWGRKNTQQQASKLFAFIFDYDGVTQTTLGNFMSGAFRAKAYPVPNYVVLSGNNCHLYYVLEEPVSLFPQTKNQLKELKYALTERIWNNYTSTEKKPQYQGINQPFRVIGGKSKVEGVRVRAFRLNKHPFSVAELYKYVPDEAREEQIKLFKDSKYTLEEAKKKFPKWYEKVIVNKDRTLNKWDISGKVHGDNPYALYDWWKRQIYTGATYRHRYFSVMAMVIYGVKCNVPAEQIKKDAEELKPYLTSIKKDDPFTDDDIMSAMDCLDDRYATFPIRDIEKLTCIPIPRNKRNYRKQADHIKIMNFIRDEVNGNKEWRNKDGRPKGSGTKEQIVADWQAVHPTGKKIECERETGLSRHTVLKWWK